MEQQQLRAGPGDETKPLERFSNRAKDYVAYRPSYPSEAIDAILAQGVVPSFNTDGSKRAEEGHHIAEFGAGTGLFTAQLLASGFSVTALEPNTAMREEMASTLSDYVKSGQLIIQAGSAEESGLSDNSADVITAAQAFHWFKVEESKCEWQRILKPRSQGLKYQVYLIWNDFDSNLQGGGTEFMAGYDALLHKYGNNYAAVSHKSITTEPAPVLEHFFTPTSSSTSTMQYVFFRHAPKMSPEAVLGRALSSSYVPKEGSDNHAPLMQELTALVHKHKHADTNTVDFAYRTQLYFGNIH
eukprot:TRINITY_DN287_c0_g1_i7.p1 TRINITY_DN287_c0_g1~~TRINITY_DN287_c0_g1_i7.p1  ORF type:complete len:299 (-),score=56.02 TRINITY_DN287_c0_g1_i7:96-992(-)